MNGTPPDAAPPSVPSPTASPPPLPPQREMRAVPAGHAITWWTDAWRLFAASPVIWIVIGLLYLALNIGLHFVPIVGQIAATLLTPVLEAGLLIGCRKLDRGGELSVADLFAGFGKDVAPLMLLGLLWLVAWIIAVVFAAFVLGLAFGFGALSSIWLADPLHMLRTLGVGALLAFLLVLLIALPLAMAYWFAPALVALRNDEPVAALRASFAAGVRNFVPFLVYGVIGLALAIVATIPLGLGWFVLGPVFAASIYTSYKDIFGD